MPKASPITSGTAVLVLLAALAFALTTKADAQAQQPTQAINQFPPPPNAAPAAPVATSPGAPPSAPAITPAPPKEDAVDAAATEIQGLAPDLSKLQGMDLQKVIEMARGLGIGAPQAPGSPADGPVTGGTIGSLASSGIIQKAQRLAFDKSAQAALLKMVATPNRATLLLYEVIFIVMMFFLKNYELSRLERGQFLRRVWISIWSTVLNLAGLGVLIPFIFFGQPYLDLLKAIARAFG